VVHERVEHLNRAFSNLDCDAETKCAASNGGSTLCLEKDLIQRASETPCPYDQAPTPAFDVATSQAPTTQQQTVHSWAGGPQYLQRAVLPLMLLKPKIEESLHLLTSHRPGEARLSMHDANWIRDELESLLAKCHESAATSSRKPAKDTLPCKKPTDSSRTAVAECKAQQEMQLERGKEAIATEFLLQESPAGKVSVRVKWTSDAESDSSAVSDIVLLLAPNPTINRDGFFISLSRLNGKFHQPFIHRSISSYAVVEPDSPIFECVRFNDIHHLRQLLETKQAAPDVRNTENESLLSVCSFELHIHSNANTECAQAAAGSLRLEICELLINEGADPNHCRW
jgi:hypothetical protein